MGNRTNWSTENDLRLLLLLIKDIQVNYAEIAQKWRDTYCHNETEEAQAPTVRSIETRLQRLKSSPAASGVAATSGQETADASLSDVGQDNVRKSGGAVSSGKKRRRGAADSGAERKRVKFEQSPEL